MENEVFCQDSVSFGNMWIVRWLREPYSNSNIRTEPWRIGFKAWDTTKIDFRENWINWNHDQQNYFNFSAFARTSQLRIEGNTDNEWNRTAEYMNLRVCTSKESNTFDSSHLFITLITFYLPLKLLQWPGSDSNQFRPCTVPFHFCYLKTHFQLWSKRSEKNRKTFSKAKNSQRKAKWY